MTDNLVEIPLYTVTLYGIQGGGMIPLAQFTVTDPSKRAEAIESLLNTLSTEERVIIANTLVFTEGYDAFRII
jgi:hypothetical protein